MQIKTSRFGEIDIDAERVIVFPEGLPGFPKSRRFVLLEHAPESPFHWLQCLDDPQLAFVVMDPLLVEPRYREAIPKEALEAAGLKSLQEAAILTLVTIDRVNQRVTANLLGPLVIHPGSRQGHQLILEDSAFSTKHEITPPAQAEGAAP